MENYKVNPIGWIRCREEGTFIELEKAYIPALKGLDGFSHLNVIWWFSGFDDEQSRSLLQCEQPYKGAPERMGSSPPGRPSGPIPSR